eukprot:GHVO01027070.1.p1 GENE.GHVO01027070.1~~GHVO01027070.1.p1  ORF type:complete len:170 (-),score=24.27 GHVO01027070.1:102-611(-)
MGMSNLFRQYATCVAHGVTPVLATLNDPIGKTFCQLLKSLKRGATAGELFKAVEWVTKEFYTKLTQIQVPANANKRLTKSEYDSLTRLNKRGNKDLDPKDLEEKQRLKAKEHCNKDLYELFELNFGLAIVERVNGKNALRPLELILEALKPCKTVEKCQLVATFYGTRS